MTTATSVHIFDFDGTIFRSPEKPEDWQGGWWSKSESLYPPFVPESPDASWYNPKVVSAIRNANSDPDAYTVLMTGRLPKLGDRVKELCRKHGITFDEWQFNKGGSTEEFKMRQMRKLVEEHGFKHVTLWEDRHVEIYRPFLDSFVENKVHEVVGFVADKPPSKNADSPDHEKQIALMKFLSGVAKKLDVSEHVYVVGGAVRDFVLGYPIKDLDIVIDPTETGKDSAWFAEQLDRHIPVNTSYATNNYGVAIITVRGDWMLDGHNLSGEVIEIANTRKETYGGSSGKGYKPSEVTSADIVEDTLRREFNFNCVGKETYVFTDKGVLQIGDIFPVTEKYILPADFKTVGKYGVSKTKAWTMSGHTKCLKITTAKHWEVVSSENHPILVLDGLDLKWVPAADIRVGDTLCLTNEPMFRTEPLPLHFPDVVIQNKSDKLRKSVLTPNKMTPDLAFILGALLAEGYVHKNRVGFVNSDTYFAQTYKDRVKSVFGLDVGTNKTAKKGDVRTAPTQMTVASKDCFDFYIDSKTLVEYLNYLGYDFGSTVNGESPSKRKRVPWSILQADKESQMAFLAAFLEGDGSFAKNTVVFLSSSCNLLKDIRMLLLSHGIVSSLYSNSVAVRIHDFEKIWPDVSKYMVTKTIKYADITGVKSRTFGGMLKTHLRKFLTSRKVGKNLFLDDNGVRVVVPNLWVKSYDCVDKAYHRDALGRGYFDVFLPGLEAVSQDGARKFKDLLNRFHFFPVTSVEDVGVQPVYDLSIDPAYDPSFSANGLVVHNTLLWRLSELANGPDKDAIIDLTGCGLSDLKNGILQCPSDPDKTFSDDPTRMIRVIKFLLRYDMKPTQDTITSIKANAKKLRNVPYEALAKLLVHDCFKEPTYAKALDYMEKYGLLSVIKDIMEKNDNFRTYMLRWSNTKPVSMMLDLMDIGLPLQANVGFLTVDQISTLREVTLGMTREDSINFLSGLRQPSSVWKDKAFFGTLLTELEVPTSDVPEFSKKVNAVARDILLENPSILLNPSTLRGSIIARLKTPNVRMGSTDWNPKKVNLISVILDDPDAPLAWFRKNITKTLPETYSHHITLWYKPPINVSEASKEKFGQEVKIRVIGYVNEPDVQAFEVSISPSGLPIAPNKFLHLTLATDHKPPSIADTMRDRVIPIDGPVFTGKIGFKMGASYFVGAGKTASTLLPVSSPVHNLREIVKQMILLEDHLFQTSKQCSDCIDKHLLSIEALAEEMVTLADSDSPYQSHGEKIAEFSRLISHFIDTSNSQGKSSYKFAASAIRSVRKSLSSHLRTVKSLLPITAEKVATKTKAEKEDASAEKLIKRSPKLKPPRKESRKERVDNVDPDIAAFKEEKYRSTSKNHKYT